MPATNRFTPYAYTRYRRAQQQRAAMLKRYAQLTACGLALGFACAAILLAAICNPI